MRLNPTLMTTLHIALVSGCTASVDGATGILSGGSFGGGGSGSLSTSDGAEDTDESGEGSGDSGGTGSLATSSGGVDSTGQPADSDGCQPVPWYADVDGDGYGDPETALEACEAPAGRVDNGDDCDDAAETVNPGAEELCDSVDNDCDVLVDEFSPSNATCNGCTVAQEGGRDFWFCAQQLGFDAARAACQGYGAELASIHSAAETTFINGQIDALPSERWWIGLTDSMQRDLFVWLDGSLVDYTNWNSGEPNDDDSGEDCVELRTSGNHEWNDIPCDLSGFYLCATAP